MKSSASLALQFAGLDHRRAKALAEATRDDERRQLKADLALDETRFVERMAQVARGPHVVLGRTMTGVPYRISLTDLTTLPGWITAGTGSGKSRFVGAVMAALLDHIVRGEPISIVAADGKGETVNHLRRSVAQMAASLPHAKREKFLSRVQTFRFFGADYLPSWPLLARNSNVAILTQADVIAEVLTENAADASLGPRQRLMLARLLAVAIEFGLPLPALPWLMSNPTEVAALAARSSLPVVRLDLSRFDREPQGSIDGLVARLGVLLGVPSLKATLSGTMPLDFGNCFEPGTITTIDFGGADMGARAAVRAMGSLAISALANAAFEPRRIVRGSTIIIVDEPQAFLTSVSLNQFERLLTLGRSQGAGAVFFVHQGATQIPAELQTMFNTNIPIRIIGRSSERDAEAASEWLPRTGRVERPRDPGTRRLSEGKFLSEAQELRHRVTEIGHLPQRHFLVADRRVDFQPRIIVSEPYDPPPTEALQPAIVAAVERGMCGVPRADLEARVRDIEEQADARFQEHRRNEPPPGRRRNRPIETPDVVGNTSQPGPWAMP
jgi:hypothetical protein